MAMEGLLTLFAGILGLLLFDAAAVAFGSDSRELDSTTDLEGEAE